MNRSEISSDLRLYHGRESVTKHRIVEYLGLASYTSTSSTILSFGAFGLYKHSSIPFQRQILPPSNIHNGKEAISHDPTHLAIQLYLWSLATGQLWILNSIMSVGLFAYPIG